MFRTPRNTTPENLDKVMQLTPNTAVTAHYSPLKLATYFNIGSLARNGYRFGPFIAGGAFFYKNYGVHWNETPNVILSVLAGAMVFTASQTVYAHLRDKIENASVNARRRGYQKPFAAPNNAAPQ